MDAADVGHCLLIGANRTGSAVPWLTGWPVTALAYVLVTPGEPDVLLVGFYNHVPNARRLVRDADVRWSGHDPIAELISLLRHRSAVALGVIGALDANGTGRLRAEMTVRDLGAQFLRLRLRKSAEEVAALRQAAALTDIAASALTEPASIGLTEYALSAKVEHAYMSRGGGHHIHYLAVSPMSRPDRCVPGQWPTERVMGEGDLLTFELSATSAPDYPGQLLRTFAVASEPTPLVRELHAVASAAFDAVVARLRPGVLPGELIEAARVIEAAGFTTLDDLVHGFGGGYLPPVVGSASRRLGPVSEEPLEEGMTLVVQPNVVTPDAAIGVQTGELVHLTAQGAELLHSFPPGLGRIG
ncbi:MAG: aminopeptidase family protein [Aeromicrobium sp.]|nr:aminopeptidase family protein [Aeromicrobium sp.]